MHYCFIRGLHNRNTGMLQKLIYVFPFLLFFIVSFTIPLIFLSPSTDNISWASWYLRDKPSKLYASSKYLVNRNHYGICWAWQNEWWWHKFWKNPCMIFLHRCLQRMFHLCINYFSKKFQHMFSSIFFGSWEISGGHVFALTIPSQMVFSSIQIVTWNTSCQQFFHRTITLRSVLHNPPPRFLTHHLL